jgi:hypothetical protein
MGSPKKIQRSPLSDQELGKKIDRLIEIRPMANEYRDLCADIKDELNHRNINVFLGRSGAVAKLVSKPSVSWLLEMLKRVLKPAQLDMYCPRKVDTRKLNQRLAALPDDKQLAKCRIEVPGKRELEVLAHGQLAAEVSKIETEEAA